MRARTSFFRRICSTRMNLELHKFVGRNTDFFISAKKSGKKSAKKNESQQKYPVSRRLFSGRRPERDQNPVSGAFFKAEKRRGRQRRGFWPKMSNFGQKMTKNAKNPDWRFLKKNPKKRQKHCVNSGGVLALFWPKKKQGAAAGGFLAKKRVPKKVPGKGYPFYRTLFDLKRDLKNLAQKVARPTPHFLAKSQKGRRSSDQRIWPKT